MKMTVLDVIKRDEQPRLYNHYYKCTVYICDYFVKVVMIMNQRRRQKYSDQMLYVCYLN